METREDTSPDAPAFREEVERLMAEPDYGRSTVKQAKVDQLYKDRYRGPPLAIGDGIEVESMPTRPPEPPREAPVSAETSATSPDVDFQGRVDTALRDRWGVAHDAKKATLQTTAEHLFRGVPGGVDGAIFEALEANVLDGLQPGATVQAHLLFAQFLDYLTRLRQGQQ